ncbi:YxlC family protein [Mesobacillus harenae]|uniref:YxlC family protein n=1 Tax=Mesobacillus harenae TaxID=2213203 RepID=UPI001580AC7F|nr:YxlC family protein [Mesobacillus harenae]
MADQKKFPPDDQQENEKELLSTISEISEGLNKLEKIVPDQSPQLDWFEYMIYSQKQQYRKRLVKELAVFLFIALFIVGGMLFTILEMPKLFLMLQGAVIVFIVLYGSIRIKKQVNM